MTILQKAYNFLILNIRYNAVVMPIIMSIYIPYNVLFIHYTAFQLLKWLSTSWLVSTAANAIIAPWVSFAYRRKWLK